MCERVCHSRHSQGGAPFLRRFREDGPYPPLPCFRDVTVFYLPDAVLKVNLPETTLEARILKRRTAPLSPDFLDFVHG